MGWILGARLFPRAGCLSASPRLCHLKATDSAHFGNVYLYSWGSPRDSVVVLPPILKAEDFAVCTESAALAKAQTA